MVSSRTSSHKQNRDDYYYGYNSYYDRSQCRISQDTWEVANSRNGGGSRHIIAEGYLRRASRRASRAQSYEKFVLSTLHCSVRKRTCRALYGLIDGTTVCGRKIGRASSRESG